MLIHRLGPLAPLLVFAAGALAFLSASRVGIALRYAGRLRAVDGAWQLFPIGIRMDASVVAIGLVPAAVLLLALPARAAKRVRPVVAGHLAAVAAILVFLEAATPPFLAQYDGRPNRLFVEYLRFPREVFSTLVLGHPLALTGTLALMGLVGWGVWRGMSALLRASEPWPLGARLLLVPPLAAVLAVGMRGGFGHRGINISTAAFSTDHLANELALDSTYSLGYALYSWRHERPSRAIYGRIPRAEAIARVRRQTLLPADAFFDPALPMLHREAPGVLLLRPYNLVIVLEESLGAEFVGSLGGLPLTPNLDALAGDGLYLTNLYATGTRTARGIEATVSGMLPTAGTSVVKLGLAQQGFFTLADLLQQHGYATEFLYGGESNFDNMASFFRGNGFERLIDEDSFRAPVFRGVWGVSDEDLFQRAHETFLAHGDQPFFALLLTTSNHDPFEFPAGRLPAGPRGGKPRYDAIRYADFALGEFFRVARTAPYFGNTVFLVVADHDTRVYGAGLVPIEKFHIPGLIVAPGVAPARLDTLASQIDLGPTLLDLMGIESAHPMIGRDLLRTPPGTPGHAFLQYDATNAYRVGDAVVIQQPYQPPQQFRWADGQLIPTPLDPELARDALAHVALPDLLYHERRYRLPAEGTTGRAGSPPEG
ncbi:MAG: LTA synthase family protein [Candidatus Binatia bacterium]